MKSMNIDLRNATWLNEPSSYEVAAASLTMTTDPKTDFWQRSYYGFRNDNGHAMLLERDDNFTFTVKVAFQYEKLFDQAGIIIYLDSENWFKASIENEGAVNAKLGSVVTNSGYSDWATVDVETPACIWYRLSRRGPDFLVESSMDGLTFHQMRIFHLHALGETSAAMGAANPPIPATKPIQFGLYACSPLESRFTVCFSDLSLSSCSWKSHVVE